jgi:hypothetical protein
MQKPNVFENNQDEPCPVCLALAQEGKIQARAVMPLPKFPALLRSNNQPCCRDCQATDATMAAGNHPDFAASRVTVANDRLSGLVTPLGMMQFMGLCLGGFMWPCSIDDLAQHTAWLESHGIPDSSKCELF